MTSSSKWERWWDRRDVWRKFVTMEDKESDEEESELSDRENRPYSIVISILRKGRCNRSRVVMVPAKGHLYSSIAVVGVPASKEYFSGLMFNYLQKDSDIRLGILPLVSYARFVAQYSVM